MEVAVVSPGYVLEKSCSLIVRKPGERTHEVSGFLGRVFFEIVEVPFETGKINVHRIEVIDAGDIEEKRHIRDEFEAYKIIYQGEQNLDKDKCYQGCKELWEEGN